MNHLTSSRSIAKNLTMVFGLALCLVAWPTFAQEVVIRSATVHPITGPSFQGSVLVEDGRIRAVGPDTEIQVPAEVRTIDGQGLDVYPGFFDAMSTVGLIEISSISATTDAAEVPKYNPHLTAATAIHPASEVIPVSRSTGLTHALVAPQPSNDTVIPGQASLVHLDGWTVEEMAIEPSVAMVIAWPQIQTRTFDFSTFSLKESSYTEAKKKAEEAIRELGDWIAAAKHYAKAKEAGSQRTDRNLELEHLSQILDGGKKVVIVANSKTDIEAAVEFAEEHDLDMVLAGANEAWKVKEMLAEKEIPVILGLVAALPQNQDDPFDLPFRTAAMLREAGVEIAFGSATPSGGFGGPSGPHGARGLPFEVGMATGYDLSREDALRALTLGPAKIFEVADELGSIEVGKRANLVVVAGDPLDIRSEVRFLLIDGEVVDLSDRHSRLYERYRSRPMPSSP